jgi:GMP synthase-like glutamine amidotransferase
LQKIKISMRIHYFQHDHFEDLGFIGEWAAERGYPVLCTRFDLSPDLPAHADYDWLVILGGKMGVNDTAEYPWLTEEIRFIRESAALGKIVIGICLGSQLIAKALGGDVFRNSVPEMGFFQVTFSADAASDPVFRHFPSPLTVMHMHFDTFNLPKGALSMARSESSLCQAFRCGSNVYAFQFHFEITLVSAETFIRETEPELSDGPFTQTPEQMRELIPICAEGNRIFRNVLEAIASTQPETC